MQKIIIIGAGPAGLTAARELQAAGMTDVTILEADKQVGGISRTVNYKGNRIDIGGHRFFSKSDWVMQWWAKVLPIQVPTESTNIQAVHLQYKGMSRSGLPINAANGKSQDEVMLVRNRQSRIYFNKQFFEYPLKLNLDALRKLGLKKTISFGISYVYARLSPIKPEQSLEDFFINRFGNKLYRQFFKEYTEKVWGVPCHQISAEWGAQRIKSLSIFSALWHAFRSALGMQGAGNATQTSLIEKFIYPKYGPGQMWETVAKEFVASGGKLLLNHKVVQIEIEDGHILGLTAVNSKAEHLNLSCDQLISTMPIKDLVQALPNSWAPSASVIANQLQYRDFITVGLLYDSSALSTSLSDNWIYIQEPGVQVGRVQVFNNWSPFMVAKENTVWLGLEFFCVETDAIWKMADEDLKQLAQREMHQIGLTLAMNAIDAVVIRVPKAYPGYFGDAYAKFDQLRSELDCIPNLYLIGRNGMHRYNNQDHSMLTAKKAVELIVADNPCKDSIWSINVDDEYHEEKSGK